MEELKSVIRDYLRFEGVKAGLVFQWIIVGVMTIIFILGGMVNNVYPFLALVVVGTCLFQFVGFLAFIHVRGISFGRLCFSSMTSWCWKLKITFRAVALTETEEGADGSYHQRNYVHEYEDTLNFVSRFTLERYLEKHQDLEVLERQDGQRLVIARDRYVRDY
ncbi:hypothetical protein HYV70_04220 [Candidatus Uhrbacteria bacterium]|nr:hypothetical protein [Candidatus Uhrbacteria bacterium]